jgi:hypothetical protein
MDAGTLSQHSQEEKILRDGGEDGICTPPCSKGFLESSGRRWYTKEGSQMVHVRVLDRSLVGGTGG